jgi:DUSAM domain-containing protein
MEQNEGEGEWHEIRMLDNRVLRGEALELTDDVCGVLRLAASTVGMSKPETDRALSRVASATTLLHEIRRRIDEGSRRLTRALDRMYTLRDEGDLDGARQQMRDILAVEVVPLYREVAEGEIEKLDELS